MRKKKNEGGLVYSTEHGRLCPGCGKPSAACSCRQQKAGGGRGGDGIVRVSRETKGRKGKGVTLVKGLPLDGEELKTLAGQLKKRCAVGGAVKDGVIEIQGDQREPVIEYLQKQGWKVKRAGG